MDDHYSVKEVLDKSTGKVHRFYSYKRKPCHRVLLTSRVAAQLAGYTLIEKDLRSAKAWLAEIEQLHTEGAVNEEEHYGRGTDRRKYLLIKGLFVAALTFYGKCFSRCDGRPVKLERSQIDDRFLALHDTCMSYRHNFAAHSGAKKLELVEVALVLPKKRKLAVMPKIYTELFQPDLLTSASGEVKISELFSHTRAIAEGKIQLLSERILNVEILPKGVDHWLDR